MTIGGATCDASDLRPTTSPGFGIMHVKEGSAGKVEIVRLDPHQAGETLPYLCRFPATAVRIWRHRAGLPFRWMSSEGAPTIVIQLRGSSLISPDDEAGPSRAMRPGSIVLVDPGARGRIAGHASMDEDCVELHVSLGPATGSLNGGGEQAEPQPRPQQYPARTPSDPGPIHFVRVAAANDGTSRITHFAPPPPVGPPALVYHAPASIAAILTFQAGTELGWRLTTGGVRRLLILLCGTSVTIVDDGCNPGMSYHPLGPGMVMLAEDFAGRGHRGKVMDGEEVFLFQVDLVG